MMSPARMGAAFPNALSFARTGREAQGSDAHAIAAGMMLAWVVMLARVAVIVAAIDPAPLPALAAPFAAMAAVKAGFALVHYRAGLHDRGGHAPSELAVRNPFSLTAAIRFGAIVAAVMLAVKLVQDHFPGVGTYVVAALGGIVSMDAITVSLAGSAKAADAARQIGHALVVATLASTVAKTALTSEACLITLSTYV